ncbi:MAG: hypothetical protein JW889_10920 [Verrucomicrobia bacterium]|nr:hypothetical protein [Verrucomicrobiota bacterium]
MAHIKVTKTQTPVEISPLIYGDFIEFIGRMTDLMWGERLDDRKFAGHNPPRLEFHFLPEEETEQRRPWRDAIWHATGRVVLDEADPYSGPRCARIEADDVEAAEIGADGATISSPGSGWVGIRQKTWVRKGERLRFAGYFRASAPVRVKVAVGRYMGCFMQPYGSTFEFEISGTKWQRIEGALAPQVADEAADFVLLLESPGTLWADSLSLMAVDDLKNHKGWRGDIVEAVKALRPGVLRFGGSELNCYGWRIGVGDRDKRAPFPRLCWGGMEWNDVGIDEFLDFCGLVEAEPLLCINAVTEGPKDAVDLMKHCAARKQGPKVRLWQIGNELGGAKYEAVLPGFCTAMKKAQPDAVLLTAYPPSEPTLKKIAPLIEYVAPHYYRPDVEQDAAETDELRARLHGMAETKHIKLAITEWNQTACWWGGGRAVQSTLGNGLYVGRMLNLYRRNGDFIGIANRSNLVDSWHSGSIQVRGSRVWFYPAYLVQRLFATHGGRSLLDIEGSYDRLDICAALEENGTACLTVVNMGTKSVRLEADLSAVGAFKSATAHVVAGNDEWITNHAAEPERIRIESRPAPVIAGMLHWEVPALSASVVTLA